MQLDGTLELEPQILRRTNPAPPGPNVPKTSKLPVELKAAAVELVIVQGVEPPGEIDIPEVFGPQLLAMPAGSEVKLGPELVRPLERPVINTVTGRLKPPEAELEVEAKAIFTATLPGAVPAAGTVKVAGVTVSTGTPIWKL